MMAALPALLASSALLVPRPLAGPLARPQLAASTSRTGAPLCQDAPGAPRAATQELYKDMEQVLRRAAQSSDALRARTARSVTSRWLDLSIEALVEATLVPGALFLNSFSCN